MNIINGIARGVSPCVRAPPSLAAEERMLRGVPTKVVCAECIKMCCLGGKNSVVKGLNMHVTFDLYRLEERHESRLCKQ